MANLSPAEVGELVSAIEELRKGTLIDRTELDKRYAATTAGLLTESGAFETAAWQKLDSKQQDEVEKGLLSLKQELGALREAYSHQDGPADVKSIMHKEYASNRAIIALTVFALFGLFFDLVLICHEWQTATAGTRGILDFTTASVSTAGSKTQETGTLSLPAWSPKERAALKPNATPSLALSALSTPSSSSPEAAGTVVSPTDATVAATSGATGSPRVSPSLEKTGPTEQAVLWMVILMGALGGFLRLASSMGNYIGNRQLLRSWFIYYILMPFQGAALAPLIYLLLRVGVLNPAITAAGGRATEGLNLIGIYGFAALTGLFSKQAIEMMADVFSTIFKKVSTKDTLEKTKPETAARK